VASGDTAKPAGFVQNATISSANDNTSNNRIALRFDTSNAKGVVVTGGVGETAFAGTLYTANTPVRWGMAYQLNNTALSVAGGAVATDTSVAIALTMTQLGIGSRNGAQDPLNGHFRSLTYYPTRLPDATLQALTS
jgi:hypothetical protein